MVCEQTASFLHRSHLGMLSEVTLVSEGEEGKGLFLLSTPLHGNENALILPSLLEAHVEPTFKSLGREVSGHYLSSFPTQR